MHDPWEPEKYNYTKMKNGRYFTAATLALLLRRAWGKFILESGSCTLLKTI